MVRPDKCVPKTFKIPQKACQKPTHAIPPSYHPFAHFPLFSGKFGLPDSITQTEVLRRLFHMRSVNYNHRAGETLIVVEHNDIEYIRLDGTFVFANDIGEECIYLQYDFRFMIFVAADHYRIGINYSHTDVSFQNKAIDKRQAVATMFKALLNHFCQEFMVLERPSTKSLCRETFAYAYRKKTKAELKREKKVMVVVPHQAPAPLAEDDDGIETANVMLDYGADADADADAVVADD